MFLTWHEKCFYIIGERARAREADSENQIRKLRMDDSQIMELGDGVERINSLGSFFFVNKQDGTLLSAAVLQNGDIDRGDDGIKWVEVTAPESQEALDTINVDFNTNYRMSEFAGR